MKKIVVATKNKGKLKEINNILGDCFEILSMEEAGFYDDIIENGSTFEENAFIKANSIMHKTNTIVLADDSGLEIDFLNKEPGIYSARYMGENTPQTTKNLKILELLNGVEKEKRTARFVSSVVVCSPNKTPITVTETLEGFISEKIEGDSGFGYDPIFFLPSHNKNIAQLSLEEKNKISHRGKALKKIKEIIKEELL